VLEDEYGRVTLVNGDGIELPLHQLVTGNQKMACGLNRVFLKILKICKNRCYAIGVVVAVVGSETDDGDFSVEVRYSLLSSVISQ
jgi:hypothetical protein